MSIQCEELEDKVAMVSEERNAQQVRIDNQLRSDRLELVQPIESLQATHAALRSQNASLQADFASVQEMKNSSKESGRSRIRKLQQSVQALQRRVDETSYVDTIYTEQKQRIESLEKKETQAEQTRRMLSDKIQCILGNVESDIIVHENERFLQNTLDITPDETGVSVFGAGQKSGVFVADRVYSGVIENGSVLSRIEDILYTALDGKVITILNLGAMQLSYDKREFLFSNVLNGDQTKTTRRSVFLRTLFDCYTHKPSAWRPSNNTSTFMFPSSKPTCPLRRISQPMSRIPALANRSSLTNRRSTICSRSAGFQWIRATRT